MRPKVVTEISSGKCKARYQVAHPGSYAIIDRRDYQISSTGLEFTLYFQSHLPEAKHIQTIVSTLDVSARSGYAVVLTGEGVVEFWVGTGSAVKVLSTGFKPASERWIELHFTIQDTVLSYEICPKSCFADIPQLPSKGSWDVDQVIDLYMPCVLVFAASFATCPNEPSIIATNFFNGRLDSPVMKSGGSNGSVLAKWDFSLKMSSDIIVDVSGKTGAQGRLMNGPTRAVTGHDWDGMESDWTKAKYGYGAIHFHEDDLDDAAWGTDFSVKLPETLRSGVYAIEIEAQNGNARDTVPFYVRPTGATSQALGAKVAYIISTFTVKTMQSNLYEL